MPKVVNVRQTVFAFLMGTTLTAGSAFAAKITAPETVDPGQEIQVRIDQAVPGAKLELRGPVTNASSGGTITSWPLNGSEADIIISEAPGSYELRQIGPDGVVLSKKLIDVAAAAITLHAPDIVTAGSEMELFWQGPAGPGNRLVILEQGTNTEVDARQVRETDGKITIQVPERTGNYKVRYMSKETVLTEAPLEVVAGGGWLRGPLKVDASQQFSVEWLGPVGQAKTVRVLTEAGEEFYAQISMSGDAQGPGFATIIAPDQPGRYVIQVIDDETGTEVTSLPLVVDPA